jgi:hypothetical protein
VSIGAPPNFRVSQLRHHLPSDASGDFFLYSSGLISASGAAALQITSANFSDSGTITLASGPGMTITGPLTQSPRRKSGREKSRRKERSEERARKEDF